MRTVRLKKRTCPYCGYEIDATSGLNAGVGRPSPGDVSICFGCGEVLLFDDDLEFREPSIDELEDIMHLYPGIDDIRLMIAGLHQ